MLLPAECVVGIALFTGIVMPLALHDPLAYVSDYPPAILERCIELGLVEPRARLTTADYVRKGIAMVLFVALFALLLTRVNGDRTFWAGFRDAYVIWLAVCWWDALVLDCVWFCHSARLRIPGTEDMPEYRDYLFHIRQSCIGTALGLPACLLVGLLVQLA